MPIVFRSLLFTAALMMLSTPPAFAHVTLNPREAPRGGFANFEVRVPTERPDADTTKVELFFPEEHPIPSVSVMPHTRWNYTIEMRELDEPIEAFGREFTEVVSKITWEGGAIKPGEFDEMEISVGPLPADADRLVFKAIQTYSSGEVVRWIEVPEEGEEVENPAPIVELLRGAEEEPAATGAAGEGPPPGEEATELAAAVTDEDISSARNLAITGLVVGALGLLAGLAGLFLPRRRAPDREHVAA